MFRSLGAKVFTQGNIWYYGVMAVVLPVILLRSSRYPLCWFPALTLEACCPDPWFLIPGPPIPFKTKMSVGRLELPTNGLTGITRVWKEQKIPSYVGFSGIKWLIFMSIEFINYRVSMLTVPKLQLASIQNRSNRIGLYACRKTSS